MAGRRGAPEIVLSESERSELEAWAASRVKTATPMTTAFSSFFAPKTEGRAGDFSLPAGHAGGDVVEERSADEVAVLVALRKLEARAVDDDPGDYLLAEAGFASWEVN